MKAIRIIGLVYIVNGVLFVAPHVWSQDYPARPIRFVVPYLPGGGTDLTARTVAQKLTEAWGYTVVVDNRGGGTGAVGSGLVARAPADGYTLLLATSSTHAIAPNLQTNLPYDPVKDFAPISLAVTSAEVLAVHPSVSANSVKELVALAKAQPGVLNYASNGNGSLAHMVGELFKAATGTNIVHIPYNGSSAVTINLLGGQVQMTFSGPGAVVPHMRAGRLKVLAVASLKRVRGLENIPTLVEAGYPGVEAEQWLGILTTAGTPKPVIDKLNREVVRILQLSDVKERLFVHGYTAAPGTPQEFGHLIQSDLAKWRKVVKVSGIRIE